MSTFTPSQRTRMLMVVLFMWWCAAPVFAQKIIWLGTLPGGGESLAYGVSADGSVVVGEVRNASGLPRAFRWTSGGGMQDLGTLGGDHSWAYGVSADGSVVVGWATNASQDQRAFRWTSGGGMQDLGTLGGNWSRAYGVSADGSVVVGWADSSEYNRAFRWTASGGMEDLNITYASLLTNGSVLGVAYAISPDGRYIVGEGYNAATGRIEAFLLDTQNALNAFSISGNLQLGDYTGDPAQIPIMVQLRQNGHAVRIETIYTDGSGDYSIPNVQAGTYDVAFKASHWLRVVVSGVVVSSADVTGVDVSLTNGDIDGDNEVTLFDFGALVAAFGSVPGDSNWNPDADLDGDEEVTLFDFGILVRNFGAMGDE
ncbi:MAG: hypothetical protein KatS3mg022_1429 [Armatimonadota bacterium]|nr:MAG: hypothetical protein KatS3mg022_1429 [Armatimonadota bacterium]